MSTLNQRKLKLVNKIKKLEKIQLYQIYNILEQNNYKTTVNTNGVFFDIYDMEQNLFKIIENYVDFGIQNNNLLKKRDEKIEKMRNQSVFEKQ